MIIVTAKGKNVLKRIIAILAALTVATTAAIALTATPAAASAPACTSLQFCIYEDDWWGQDSNAIYQFSTSSFSLDVCYNLGSAWQDRTQSARLNYFNFPGQYVISLYANNGCGGLITSVVSGSTSNQMRTSCSSDGSWVGWRWNCANSGLTYYVPVISSWRMHHNT